jgi:YidC/Oxa1 family membrane protein insertase
MDSKRLIIFIVLSFAVMTLWQRFFAPPPAPQTTEQAQVAPTQASSPVMRAGEVSSLSHGQRISVNTDVLHAEIDTMGGDLRSLTLLKYDSTADARKSLALLSDLPGQVYVAQTGLIASSNPALPSHKTVFSAAASSYQLSGDRLEVTLTAPEANGVKVTKTYVFKRGSYDIGVRYDITNGSHAVVAPAAYFRMLRDNSKVQGETRFASTFTGPALFTDAGKFQKIKFTDLDKGTADYAKNGANGWVGMLQHYFMTAWIMKPLDGPSVCDAVQSCQFQLDSKNGLYSSGAMLQLKPVLPGQSFSLTVPLYAGPEDYDIITKVADSLKYAKDYGMLYIISSPLFWLLTQLHALVSNWGWAIVLLTLIIKGVFYPLTAASYRSMGKMKALAPRLERLKTQHGDDRGKFQAAVMEMYKQEKVNPLGGCLPMVIQIPVFIGLYWALLASVELRQAPWVLWIHDLARPDPYYVLPLLMAITMFAQTFLNPPPTDPMQAKMMKVMPLAFSAMFFFFPAGLVLYYVLNSLLSITQQWHINRQIERSRPTTVA